MAEDDVVKSKKTKLPKKAASFREKIVKDAARADRVPRGRRAIRAGTTPLKAIRTISRREFHINPSKSENGSFVHKSRKITPSYFRNSFAELKNVTWPSRRESIRLTGAVILFSVIFGVIVAVVDYGLDKLFKGVILK